MENKPVLDSLLKDTPTYIQPIKPAFSNPIPSVTTYTSMPAKESH
jgi:hypothetical protein